MVTTNFPPTGTTLGSNGTITWYPSESQLYLYDADDATNFQMPDADQYALFPIGNMPGDFDVAISITIRFRMRNQAKGVALGSVQLMKSDGTTAICGQSSTTSTPSFVDYTFSPGSLDYTDKTSFDGAKIRIQNNSDGGGFFTTWSELSVDVTYSSTDIFVPGVAPSSKPLIHSFALQRATRY